MTVEARVLFVALFFAAWAFMGLLTWASVAVLRRGDGAILALPLSLGGACACGVAVPLAGLDDGTGLLLSLVTAMAGSLVGYAFVLALLGRTAPSQPTHSQPAEVPPREKG